MATVSTRSLSQIRLSFIAAAQASAAAVSKFLDFSVGSVCLALAEASGAVGLWLQKIALQVLALTRFSTSTGTDADSWGAQFGFNRLPAVAATGTVTFTRTSTTTRVVVPANADPTLSTEVETADGTQSFAVTIDTANAAWSTPDSGYVMAIGIGTVTVPVQDLVAGTGGNVLAATITRILSALSFSATVSNAAAYTNGTNAETDQAYVARFPTWLQGLASADYAAIVAAIQGVQQNLDFFVVENLDYPGTVTDNGNFFVVLNDGSGNPPSTLLSSVTTAINAVRGFTIRYQGTYAPTPVTVNATMVLTTDPAYTHGAVVEQVIASLTSFINNWKLKNKTLGLTQLANVAFNTSPGITDVTGLLINGVAADLTLTTVETLSAGTMNVS